MEENRAKRAVDDINTYLQQNPWFDFEIMEYGGDTLVVMASLDTSAPHDLEIRFKGVFFVSLPMEWKTDTSSLNRPGNFGELFTQVQPPRLGCC